MADGLGVLLLTWNQAFYRYGSFDFDKLELCLENNFNNIDNYRKRDIQSLGNIDEIGVIYLFDELLEALAIKIKEVKRSSPVAVGKAMHILAPNYFPLWDKAIAKAYGFNLTKPAKEYFSFCKISKEMLNEIKGYNDDKLDKPLLRLIDEFNYSKYTKKWI